MRTNDGAVLINMEQGDCCRIRNEKWALFLTAVVRTNTKLAIFVMHRMDGKTKAQSVSPEREIVIFSPVAFYFARLLCYSFITGIVVTFSKSPRSIANEARGDLLQDVIKYVFLDSNRACVYPLWK